MGSASSYLVTLRCGFESRLILLSHHTHSTLMQKRGRRAVINNFVSIDTECGRADRVVLLGRAPVIMVLPYLSCQPVESAPGPTTPAGSDLWPKSSFMLRVVLHNLRAMA